MLGRPGLGRATMSARWLVPTGWELPKLIIIIISLKQSAMARHSTRTHERTPRHRRGLCPIVDCLRLMMMIMSYILLYMTYIASYCNYIDCLVGRAPVFLEFLVWSQKVLLKFSIWAGVWIYVFWLTFTSIIIIYSLSYKVVEIKESAAFVHIATLLVWLKSFWY